MNKPPRYLVTDRFEFGMLASLTAELKLTEISLEDVCQLIEEAEREKQQGLHGGWGEAAREVAAVPRVPHGSILLVACPVVSDRGVELKWARVEVVERPLAADR